MAPTVSSTLPSDSVMNLQSAAAVCINGLISEQYFSNAMCQTVDPTTMIGYGVSVGPNFCVNGKADMQIPGVAMFPQAFGVTTTGFPGTHNQYYVGPRKLVTCSQGDPVPPNAAQTPTGWAYTAAFTGPGCTGTLEGMHEGHPTGMCLYDPRTQGGVMYSCDSSGGAGGYTASYFDDPGCTIASTTAGIVSGSHVAATMTYTGDCQSDPSTFSPKMGGRHSPNFASQQNMCDDSSPRLPEGLGVTVVKKENNDCTGRTVGFWSLSFGAHNVTDFVHITGETTNPQVYTTLSCDGSTCEWLLGGCLGWVGCASIYLLATTSSHATFSPSSPPTTPHRDRRGATLLRQPKAHQLGQVDQRQPPRLRRARHLHHVRRP